MNQSEVKGRFLSIFGDFHDKKLVQSYFMVFINFQTLCRIVGGLELRVDISKTERSRGFVRGKEEEAD